MEIIDINPENQERKNQLTFHHSRPLDLVSYGVVRPISPLEYGRSDPDISEFFEHDYQWIKDKIGFYPIFLSVGRTNEDLDMTGYSDQWRRVLSKGKDHTEYRKKGQFPNEVLFSFAQTPPQGVFTDYDNWHMIQFYGPNREMPTRIYQSILRPSWNRNDWVTFAKKYPNSVQLLVPSLDLRQANAVFVRNRNTKERLEAMGFNNVKVARLLLPEN